MACSSVRVPVAPHSAISRVVDDSLLEVAGTERSRVELETWLWGNVWLDCHMCLAYFAAGQLQAKAVAPLFCARCSALDQYESKACMFASLIHFAGLCFVQSLIA